MNTQLYQPSTSAALPPGTTQVAARGGWFTRNWKGPALTSLIVFLVLPLALLGSALAAPPAAEQAGVIQTQETNEGGVTGELIECRRSEGVLTIKVRFRNTSNKPAQVTFTHWNDSNDNPKFYVAAGNKKYFMLKDTDGTVLSSNSTGNGVHADLGPGKTYLWWAKYPAPPAEVKKVNFMTPVAPPFEDVPVTDK
ncbi:MAG: hypothetical protein WBQ43_23090 [Terriglobales bacterium]